VIAEHAITRLSSPRGSPAGTSLTYTADSPGSCCSSGSSPFKLQLHPEPRNLRSNLFSLLQPVKTPSAALLTPWQRVRQICCKAGSCCSVARAAASTLLPLQSSTVSCCSAARHLASDTAGGSTAVAVVGCSSQLLPHTLPTPRLPLAVRVQRRSANACSCVRLPMSCQDLQDWGSNDTYTQNRTDKIEVPAQKNVRP
jgi:hypothetical protein